MLIDPATYLGLVVLGVFAFLATLMIVGSPFPYWLFQRIVRRINADRERDW